MSRSHLTGQLIKRNVNCFHDISGSSLVPNSSQETPYVPPSEDDVKKLFDPMFDELYESTTNDVLIPTTEDAHIPVNEVNPSVSISVSQEAPAADPSVSSTNHHSSNVHHGNVSGINDEVNPFATPEDAPFENIFAPESSSEPSSSGDIDSATSVPQQLPHEHLRKWTHDHPLDNIIGNPSRPVSTRKQLATDALWCFFNSVLSKIEPKDVKTAMNEDSWFNAMQEEIHEFDRLDVWELVPAPDCAMIIALKWIFKVKLDEHGDVLKNKARLVAKGYRQEEGIDFE